MISFTMPVPTLTCLSLSSEARKAAASVHRTEFDGEATGEAVTPLLKHALVLLFNPGAPGWQGFACVAGRVGVT